MLSPVTQISSKVLFLIMIQGIKHGFRSINNVRQRNMNVDQYEFCMFRLFSLMKIVVHEETVA